MTEQDQHPSSGDNEHAATQPPSANRKSRRGRRIAAWSGVTIVTLLVAVAGTAVWAVKTESGTRFIWNTAVNTLGGKLTGQLQGGTIADGVRLREVHYKDDKRELQIDSIDASWHLALAARKFSVRHLRLGTVDFSQQPSPPEPSTMPTSLSLPLALDLNNIALDKLRFTQGASTTELSNLRLHGDSDGTQHTLVLDSLTTPFGNTAAMVHLNGKQPFAISGGLELAGEYKNESLQEKYQVAAQLSGSLQELGVALKASGDKLSGTADVIATPFADVPVKQAKIDLKHINPQAFNAAAPQADLNLRADLAPDTTAGKPADANKPGDLSGMAVTGTIALDNAKPGSLDRQLLPLNSLQAKLALTLASQKITDLSIRLPKNGRIEGGGEFHPANEAAKQAMGGQFKVKIADLDLNQLHGQMKPTRLAGPLDITLSPDAQKIVLVLDDRDISARVDTTIRPEQIDVQQLRLTAKKSVLEAAGTLGTSGPMKYAIKGKLASFNPTDWLQVLENQTAQPARGKKNAHVSKPMQANVNMDFDASGALSPEFQLKLAFGLHDSSYADLPMRGKGDIRLIGTRLQPSQVELLVAGNTLNLNGSFGGNGDKLNLKIDAPQLDKLGYGLSGLLKLDGQLTGTQQRPNLHATYQAEQLKFGAHSLHKLAGEADLKTDLNAGVTSPNNRLALRIEGDGYHGPQAELDKLNLKLAGTYANHTLDLQANGKLEGHPLALNAAVQGKVTEKTKGNYGWAGTVNTLENKGFPQIKLASPLTLDVAQDVIEAGATKLDIDRMSIELQRLSYRQGRIASAGRANALDIGRLLEIAHELTGMEIPLKTTLVLDSDWDFSLAESASGHIQIARKSGDIRVTASNGETALGLSALKLRTDFQGQQMRVAANATADRVGTLEVGGDAGLQRVDGVLTLADNSPLNIKGRFNVPELKRVGDLIGPQVSLNGKIAMDLAATGTLGQPKLSGAVNGDNMAVTLFDQGIQLKDGIARITMDNNVIDLKQLEFHGGKGTLRAEGKVQLGDSNPDLNAAITADHLELFASPDRQLMLSGQAKLANVNEQLRIDGKFVVDKGLFDLPKSSAPKLGDDVVIVRSGQVKAGAAKTSKEKLEAASEKPAGKFAPTINVAVDLGNNFRFRGTGADLLLRGDMNVRSEPLTPLRATGTINVAEGTYEAFGTKLNIERGIINFQGPISNPNINILAMRRNQDVEAGVEVTGNANQPRVRLVSEPNVSDDEKLSWMMFGHGSESSGIGQRNAASQALALLGNAGGKRIAKDIGLDQFSIGASESGLTDDQVVNLGKAISEKITLGYEQSLQGAASVAKATWQISRRWSLVARAGTINGLNVLFNRRFD